MLTFVTFLNLFAVKYSLENYLKYKGFTNAFRQRWSSSNLSCKILIIEI